MGYTTKISDYEWNRGDGTKEVPEGYDPRDEKVEREKVVKPKEKKPPISSTSIVKDKDAESK